jgi:hypothetical protein
MGYNVMVIMVVITVVKMYMIKVFRSCLVKNMYVHECLSLSQHETYDKH